MKKLVLAAALIGASSLSMAAAPGGPGCGWGNMIMDGKTGLVSHLLALTTNGTSGNALFGMTSGTNGCDVDVPLTYKGQAMVSIPGFMEEVASDMSQGQGEALNAFAVSLGIEKQDRAHFSTVMQSQFDSIFTSADLTTADFLDNVVAVIKADTRLAKYAA